MKSGFFAVGLPILPGASALKRDYGRIGTALPAAMPV